MVASSELAPFTTSIDQLQAQAAAGRCGRCCHVGERHHRCGGLRGYSF
ncbi:Poly(A) RNA polymerase, mitochondrial, partial [Corchorus olitorius]